MIQMKNCKFRSEYFTWSKLQVTSINTGVSMTQIPRLKFSILLLAQRRVI